MMGPDATVRTAKRKHGDAMEHEIQCEARFFFYRFSYRLSMKLDCPRFCLCMG